MALARQRADPDAAEAGFFGKVPSHGDFVSNRFDRRLREQFDSWLQRGIADSRRQLDEAWDEAFADMPAWRFALGADVTGGRPVVGVMAASADRVGREFPIVVALRLPSYEGPTRALCDCKAWFDAAEALVVTAQDEAFDLDLFDDDVSALPAIEIGPGPAEASTDADRDRSFWWRVAGAARGARFASVGLPAASEFHRLLAAEQEERSVPPPQPRPAAPEPAPAPDFVVESAVASNPGARMRINADAWTSRPNLHAVADGVGDHPSAADASKVALAKLRQIADAETLDELIRLAKGALGGAHAILRAGAPDSEERPSASVAAIALAGGRFAAIWAGDARCYLLREGLLRRLTRDHVEVGMTRRLSRSVGGRTALSPEVAADDLAAGDRFLICTQPLAGVLGDRVIAEALLTDAPRQAAERLIQEALIAGCAGNVTAMVVHAAAA